jgi:hypothetical protein
MTPDASATSRPRFDAAASHLHRVVTGGLADFGPAPCRMWMSAMDVRCGRYPLHDDRPADFVKRVYRNIDAPRGCSVYWDQPLLAAAHRLSAATGDPRFANAADACIADFLERCVSGPTGLPLWGNHYYWDAFDGCVKRFLGDETPQPVDPAADPGDLHELRPLLPEWNLLWRIDAGKVERAIRAMAQLHVCDDRGAFNRHADGKQDHAFLEAGGILVQSMAWLAAKTDDRTLTDMALRIARFSAGFAGEATGLIPVSPLSNRWDHDTCTSEVGLWAQCLLQADPLTGESAFTDLAATAVGSYLRHAWDDRALSYFGRLAIHDGQPRLEPTTWPYMPGDHVDLWEPLFPRHDYPMHMAEACIMLHRRTGDRLFLQGIGRWLGVIERSLPARGGRGGYAEHYGRCIRFAVAAAGLPGCEYAAALARRVTEEAMATLHVHGMFRGHPGEDRCDAVDGVGVLLDALMDLHALEQAASG